MKVKPILLCPICGDVDSLEYKVVDGGYWWCYQGKEIIPLVTPQELQEE